MNRGLVDKTSYRLDSFSLVETQSKQRSRVKTWILIKCQATRCVFRAAWSRWNFPHYWPFVKLSKRANNVKLLCCFCCWPEQATELRFELSVMCNAMALMWRHCDISVTFSFRTQHYRWSEFIPWYYQYYSGCRTLVQEIGWWLYVWRKGLFHRALHSGEHLC